MEAVTREKLDGLQCAGEGCDHDEHGELYLHSRCHPGVPTWAVYEDGVIRVECAECKAPVVAVRVAENGAPAA